MGGQIFPTSTLFLNKGTLGNTNKLNTSAICLAVGERASAACTGKMEAILKAYGKMIKEQKEE
jgi:hypothetical protein